MCGKHQACSLLCLTVAVNTYLLFVLFPQVVGLNTNINFLGSLCEHSEFQQGNVHTDFIKVQLYSVKDSKCILYSTDILRIPILMACCPVDHTVISRNIMMSYFLRSQHCPLKL